MKGLNSILLEGIIIPSGRKASCADTTMAALRVQYQEKPGSPYVHKGKVPLDVSMLSQAIRANIGRGRSVRIVGCLRVCPDGSLVVYAEHVELMPVLAVSVFSQAKFPDFAI